MRQPAAVPARALSAGTTTTRHFGAQRATTVVERAVFVNVTLVRGTG
jgi:hypothetical protein